MPHMEKPRALNIVLNNEQIQSKNELLDHISQETDVLRSDKRAVIYKNVELFFARKYKKLFPTIRFYFPYAASALITYGIFAALHITPFVVDHNTKHMHYKEYLDSFGNHSSEEQYDLFTHKKNEIRYYSEWKISEDGSYYRDVKIYYPKENDKEQSLEAFSHSIYDDMGTKYGSYENVVERKQQITESELNSEPYATSVYYFDDEAIFYTYDESDYVNVVTTAAWGGAFLVSQLFVYMWRKSFSNFSVSLTFDEINEKYPYKSIGDAKRRINLVNENIRRLGGR